MAIQPYQMYIHIIIFLASIRIMFVFVHAPKVHSLNCQIIRCKFESQMMKLFLKQPSE